MLDAAIDGSVYRCVGESVAARSSTAVSRARAASVLIAARVRQVDFDTDAVADSRGSASVETSIVAAIVRSHVLSRPTKEIAHGYRPPRRFDPSAHRRLAVLALQSSMGLPSQRSPRSFGGRGCLVASVHERVHANSAGLIPATSLANVVFGASFRLRTNALAVRRSEPAREVFGTHGETTARRNTRRL